MTWTNYISSKEELIVQKGLDSKVSANKGRYINLYKIKGFLGFKVAELYKLANRAPLEYLLEFQAKWRSFLFYPSISLLLNHGYLYKPVQMLTHKLWKPTTFCRIIFWYWLFFWFCVIFKIYQNEYQSGIQIMFIRGSTFHNPFFYVENLKY